MYLFMNMYKETIRTDLNIQKGMPSFSNTTGACVYVCVSVPYPPCFEALSEHDNVG